MKLDRKSRLLRKYLPQVAPQEVFENPRSTLESFGFEGPAMESAGRGVEVLRAGETLEATQAANLEAIIHKQFRPAVLIVNDNFDTPPAPWEFLANSENRERIQRAILAVGRVELPGFRLLPFGGTGFVVGENLVMTNRHVAEIFARGLGDRRLQFKTNQQAAINFRKEIVPSPQILNLSVEKVLMIHPFWDMALLKVVGLSESQKPLRLSTKHPDELKDRNIVVLGYPAQDERNELLLQNQIFAGIFGVKRLQPGLVRERRPIESFENVVNALTHDASTLGGNSGSAVVDVETGDVIALHFAGLYLDANFAVPTFELARDSRVVDAGVNFGEPVEKTSEWNKRWLVADELESAKVSMSAKPNVTSGNKMQTNSDSVTWTIPLRVTVSIGTPSIASDVKASTPLAPASASEGVFGDGEDPAIVEQAYRRFSANSLGESGFSWQTALAAAAASHLAYQESTRVIDVAKGQWKFETCDFIQANDTEAFVASTANEVLISFRGTSNIRDWIRDLTLFSTNVSFGSVHRGFYLGFQQARPQIDQVLERVQARNKRIVVTGHSLGGALATIAAADWSDVYSITSVYTFGQPAVGKESFRNFMQRYESRFFRIVNDDDIIAQVPPGYVHAGTLFRFGPSGTVSNESLLGALTAEETPTMSEPEFFALQEACEQASRIESSMAPGVEGLLPSFSDHKLFRYMSKIMLQAN